LQPSCNIDKLPTKTGWVFNRRTSKSLSHLDLATDTDSWNEVDKAYTELKNKKGTKNC
jgi:hypothetical protein